MSGWSVGKMRWRCDDRRGKTVDGAIAGERAIRSAVDGVGIGGDEVGGARLRSVGRARPRAAGERPWSITTSAVPTLCRITSSRRPSQSLSTPPTDGGERPSRSQSWRSKPLQSVRADRGVQIVAVHSADRGAATSGRPRSEATIAALSGRSISHSPPAPSRCRLRKAEPEPHPTPRAASAATSPPAPAPLR